MIEPICKVRGAGSRAARHWHGFGARRICTPKASSHEMARLLFSPVQRPGCNRGGRWRLSAPPAAHLAGRVAQRPASAEESALLLQIVDQQRQELAAHAELTSTFAKNGDAPPAADNSTEATTWATIARVLLNLDETITRE